MDTLLFIVMLGTIIILGSFLIYIISQKPTIQTVPTKVVDDKLLNKIKRSFEAYFQGYDFEEWGGVYPPASGEDPISLNEFGIHLLELDNKVLTIWLSRPGIFIGRAGERIDGFKKFLKEEVDSEIEITLKEFNPFKCVTI